MSNLNKVINERAELARLLRQVQQGGHVNIRHGIDTVTGVRGPFDILLPAGALVVSEWLFGFYRYCADIDGDGWHTITAPEDKQ